MATTIVAQPAATAINPAFLTINLPETARGENGRNGSLKGVASTRAPIERARSSRTRIARDQAVISSNVGIERSVKRLALRVLIEKQAH